MNINLFALAGLSVAIVCFLLSFFIFVSSKGKLPRLWALFNISVGIFGFGTFLVGISQTYQQAFLSWKITLFGVSYIAMFFYHVVYEFCKLKNKTMLQFVYFHGILFSILGITTSTIFHSMRYAFNQFYYYEAGIGFNILFSVWLIIVLNAFGNLFLYLRRTRGLSLMQGKYLFWGMLLGFLGGSTTSFPSWGIDIYPAWHFFICVYIAVSTYAIFKYQLMDIRIVVTRLSVFVLVYTFILGLPLGLVFWGRVWLTSILGQEWFWGPLLTLLALATTGPFVFLYLQRKAEAILLQEEQRTQDLLNQASYGMNTIHSLQKLLKLIIDVVVKTLGLNTAKIYLLNNEAEQYILRAPEAENGIILNKEDRLIQLLKEKQYPLVYDEIKMFLNMKGEDASLSEIEIQMRNLSASIVVPMSINNSLLGYLALGERRSKEIYTKGLLNTLAILGNQCALAIDRCYVVEAETKRLEAEGLKERMVSLDHMASSMAHEIDNPIHIIRTSLSFVQSALLRDPRVSMPGEIKQDFDDSLSRSLNASERVSSMIKAILDYSRMGTGKLESVRINDALEGFLQLIQPQIREEKVQFTKEIENDLPPVLGDRVQIEEVFMNFVRNSLHAVRRNEEKKISLKIYKKTENAIRIECWDNGYGIPKEIINDIFLSSMTTKGSSEGTGLGLYRVRKIVDLFRGKVWAESEGKGKGATFIVELPVYEGHKNNTNGA